MPLGSFQGFWEGAKELEGYEPEDLPEN